MFPTQCLRLLRRQPAQFHVDVSALPLLAVPPNPQQHQRAHDKQRPRGDQVETVADVVVGRVSGQEGPASGEPTDVAHHAVGVDGTAAGRVADHVGAHLRIGQRAQREGRRGDQEGAPVADERVLGFEQTWLDDASYVFGYPSQTWILT